MNSYLISGGTGQERLKKAQKLISDFGFRISDFKNNPDLLIIEPLLSIGINQIRSLQKFLSRKPYQLSIKTALIPQAEKLTIPAQNAFLKTLEEPPANSLIILTCQSQEQLLATIVSRCQTIKLVPKPEVTLDQPLITHYSLLITQLSKAGVGERLKLVEPYTKSREEAVKFCQEMLTFFLSHHLSHPKGVIPFTPVIKALQKTLNLLQANVNVKLALENLVINLNSTS